MNAFTRLAREWIAPTLILILTLGMLVAAIFYGKRGPEAGAFHNFEVQDVIDGKTLSVRWLDNEEGILNDGVSRFEITGIWSDKDKEPEAWYENRVEFFKDRLLQRVIRVRTHIVVVVPSSSEAKDEDGDYSPPGPQEPTKVLDVINSGSEVLLEDGTSLSEQTLEEGYAAFDFLDQRLAEEDRFRYDAAEQRAKQKALGIWSSQETAQTYSATREKYELREHLKRTGSIYYILFQLLFGVVILVLMYAARNDTPSFYAAAKLLILPVAMLMTELTRRTWIQMRPDDDLILPLYGFYLVVAASIIGLGVKQFIVLVAYGPLKEWQTLWRISRARRALRYFAIALLCSVFVYGLAYRFFGDARSLKTAAILSFSQTYSLNLPVVIERTTALNTISTLQTVSIWVLLLVFGSLVPGLREKPI